MGNQESSNVASVDEITLKLRDGPAARTYLAKRAPIYLRAVVNPK